MPYFDSLYVVYGVRLPIVPQLEVAIIGNIRKLFKG